MIAPKETVCLVKYEFQRMGNKTDLFLGEKICVYHLGLDGDQSERLKRQTALVSVVVLRTQTKVTWSSHFILHVVSQSVSININTHSSLYTHFTSFHFILIQSISYLGFCWHHQNNVFNSNAKQAVLIVPRF